MKAEIEALKNQIESDKAAHIVEELHKNIKDNEEELEQVKKTHIKTVQSSVMFSTRMATLNALYKSHSRENTAIVVIG